MRIKAKHKLIPAIAMLLVSAVLLTTASYAWFTMSRTVQATNMQLTAIAPTNLLISDREDGTYAETARADEQFTGKLIPVSSISGASGTFYAARNINAANYGAPNGSTAFDSGSAINAITADQDGHYADYTFWLKTDGEDPVDVTLSQLESLTNVSYVGATNDVKYMNVRFADEAAFATGKTSYGALYTRNDGTYTEVGDAAFASATTDYYYQVNIANAVRIAILDDTGAVFASASGDSLYDFGNANYFPGINGPMSTGSTYTGTSATNNMITANTTLFTVPNGDTATPIIIRVWIEGQDIDCVSPIAANTFRLNVGFSDVTYAEGVTDPTVAP